jgi:hypothetical protein
MPSDLAVRCGCGAVRGTARGVSGDRGNRVVCYCDDCQSFAHFLDCAERTLDDHGGTEIFQMSSARLELAAGADRLACIRLAPGGLLRWYAACCRTPIGNTLASRQVPFLGLILACTDAAPDRRPRDTVLGPIRARLHTRFAHGNVDSVDASDRVPVWLMLRLFGMGIAARLRGDHRRSPFFAPESGAPISPPRVLSAAELTAVRAEAGLG